MSDAVHIIYVPGLGDKYDGLRRWCLGLWRYRGVSVELVPMRWADGESYEQKFDRLSQAIDAASGKRVVLVGESAGGSMVVNMYAARVNDLHKVMTVCGKNKWPEYVNDHFFRKNPAFKPSIYETSRSIEKLTPKQRGNFISITPLFDSVVPVPTTLLPDCRHVRLWTVGHQTTVLLLLTVLSWKIIRLAR